MEKPYAWHTKIGPFYIAESAGHFDLFFQDDTLGTYANPQLALADLGGGHKFTLAGGAGVIQTATLAIPASLNRWSRLL